MDEKEAIDRLKRGDIRGLEGLVRQHQVAATRAAYLITRDLALAEDIVQTAFIRVYERIAQFDGDRPFAPWFMRIVANDAIKAVARTAPAVSLDSPLTAEPNQTLADLLADHHLPPAEKWEQAETRQAVWQALGQLTAAQRGVLVMRYYLELDEPEMAERLGCPPGTVKSRLNSARSRLRTLMETGRR